MQILALLPFAILFTAIAGWVTHIVWSITTLLGDVAMTVNQGAIAIIGAIIPPIGTIHGIYLWF